MRPLQQNRRINNNNKHRPNLNRKPQNMLSKSFESNGPGIKVRGNAQHVYEKYVALARDAQATGDNVIAENFLQHAEHYKRLIIEATANQQSHTQETKSSTEHTSLSAAEVETEEEQAKTEVEAPQLEITVKKLAPRRSVRPPKAPVEASEPELKPSLVKPTRQRRATPKKIANIENKEVLPIG